MTRRRTTPQRATARRRASAPPTSSPVAPEAQQPAEGVQSPDPMVDIWGDEELEAHNQRERPKWERLVLAVEMYAALNAEGRDPFSPASLSVIDLALMTRGFARTTAFELRQMLRTFDMVKRGEEYERMKPLLEEQRIHYLHDRRRVIVSALQSCARQGVQDRRRLEDAVNEALEARGWPNHLDLRHISMELEQELPPLPRSEGVVIRAPEPPPMPPPPEPVTQPGAHLERHAKPRRELLHRYWLEIRREKSDAIRRGFAAPTGLELTEQDGEWLLAGVNREMVRTGQPTVSREVLDDDLSALGHATIWRPAYDPEYVDVWDPADHVEPEDPILAVMRAAR